MRAERWYCCAAHVNLGFLHLLGWAETSVTWYEYCSRWFGIKMASNGSVQEHNHLPHLLSVGENYAPSQLLLSTVAAKRRKGASFVPAASSSPVPFAPGGLSGSGGGETGDLLVGCTYFRLIKVGRLGFLLPSTMALIWLCVLLFVFSGGSSAAPRQCSLTNTKRNRVGHQISPFWVV